MRWTSSSTRYLRTEERVHIADRLREKVSIREIARELGRSPSSAPPAMRCSYTCPSTTPPNGCLMPCWRVCRLCQSS
ncbi:helix-turn-helix domain-containing protein [Streptosporangium sp. G11]|uniref:helix-turn-helix domain-containing protein n=1 Tax=Streptosporangium sp. G11 TaxID=3436926 RepID=UPI003EBF24AA